MKVKFYVEPPRLGGTIFVCEILVECLTWPPCSHMPKSAKNRVLLNRWADFYETGYVVFGTPASCSLNQMMALH